jgi:hypothetical protein
MPPWRVVRPNPRRRGGRTDGELLLHPELVAWSANDGAWTQPSVGCRRGDKSTGGGSQRARNDAAAAVPETQ